MLLCNACNTMNDAGAKRCALCGRLLVEPKAPKVAPVETVTSPKTGRPANVPAAVPPATDDRPPSTARAT